MAYTIKEIEKALTTDRPELQLHDHGNELRKQSVNYPIILDYLSGQTPMLANLQHDDKVYYWHTLINLLGSIDKINEGEQLVLDVIYHPVLFPYMEHYFNTWLISQAMNDNTHSLFSTVVQQFNKQGMKNDDIFNYLIFHIGFDFNRVKEISDSPLKQFLLNYIRNSRQLIYPKIGYLAWNDDWSLFYFQLLEESVPHFASEYVLYGISLERNNPVDFLLNYKQGKYLPDIVSFLRTSTNSSLREIGNKFGSAVRLYDHNSEEYKPLVLEVAHNYLQYFQANHSKQTWEAGYPLKTGDGEESAYQPYSAVAIHYLLKYERQNALNILNEWFSKKFPVDFKVIRILHYHLQQEAFPYIEQAVINAVSASIDYYRMCIGLLRQNFEPSLFLPLIWTLTNSKTKSLRDLIAKTLVELDHDAEGKAIALLNSKNSETRQTAATILSYYSTEKSRTSIVNVLNKESNDKARDILLQTIADSLPKQADEKFINEMVEAAKQRKKLDKPVEAWLNEEQLPPLFYQDGTRPNNETVRFLLYRMSRVKAMNSDIEAKYIVALLDKEKSAPFAAELVKVYIEKGAKPEYKYLMALAALLGNDAVIDKIRVTINKWMEENRYKMAEHGVGALALHGSDKALRWVEWYSRKYKSKKANVGNAALVALETAADELGITTHELGDRIVPDFGFDGLFKHFKIGDEEYRAFIDSNFKIAFFNEDDKKLKSIPAAADAVLKDEFKAIAKEVRDIVKSQSSRLEYYLIIQRKWTFPQWQKFFLQNPVMFIYATKILWGVYDDKENLIKTFLCNEDTSLQDVSASEISIDEDTFIGIVHPTQLDKDALQQWKQQIFDLAIEPIFPQLDRRMPDMKDIDLSKPIITKFEGRKTVQGSIRSTLEKYGWHKGPTGDGGVLESFNLLYFEKKIEAVLEIEGVGAGYGWGMDESLGRLFVIDKTKITQKWFNHPGGNDDERLIKLGDVPVIFLSEMLAAVESVKQVEKEL